MALAVSIGTHRKQTTPSSKGIGTTLYDGGPSGGRLPECCFLIQWREAGLLFAVRLIIDVARAGSASRPVTGRSVRGPATSRPRPMRWFAPAPMQSVGPDSVFIGRREQFVALASCFAVPAVYSFRSFTASGGL